MKSFLIVFILIACFKEGFIFEVYKIEQLNRTTESSIEIIYSYNANFYTARSHCMIYKLSARYEAVKKLPTIQAYKESILRV